MAMEQFVHADEDEGLIIRGRHEEGGRVIIDSITPILDADTGDLVALVERWLSEREVRLTPHAVAEALRVSGRPVGDATILSVYEQIRKARPTPGLPDPKHIVGEWTPPTTGESESVQARQALAYRDLISRLRNMHGRLALRRQVWAEVNTDSCAATRAVTYQSVMADLNAAITEAEQIASGQL